MAPDRKPASGEPVDRFGGPADDPTQNVFAWMAQESRRQDDLRLAESRYQNDQREAEHRRIRELAAQRDMYESRISEMLRLSVLSTSDLIAKQLDRLTLTIESRLMAVERTQIEAGGKGAGRSELFAWAIAGVLAVSGVVGIIAALA